MTEKIYWNDAYAKEFTASVVKSWKGDDGNACVVLDRTAFYPTGGGQPNDTGTISCKSVEYAVTDVRKDGEDVVHVLSSGDAPSQGSAVSGRIDWDRRYAHMRYHTALHIMDGIVQKTYKGRITGGQIYADRSRIEFDIPGMDRSMAQGIVDASQRIADEGHEVVARMLSKEDASAMPGLARTSPGAALMSGMETVRVIDIVGFDMQLDGGTHVSNTKEVGRMSLMEYKSNGAHNKRIYIVLG